MSSHPQPEALSAEAMLARLTGFASVVGRPNGEIVEFVRGWLAAHGATVTVIPGPEGDRANVFATIGDDPGSSNGVHDDPSRSRRHRP